MNSEADPAVSIVFYIRFAEETRSHSVSVRKLHIGYKIQPIGDEKLHIEGKKTSIDPEKPHIEGEKPLIGSEKPSIEDLVSKYNLTQPTAENIHRLLCAFGTHIVFGRSIIMAETGLEIIAAGVLINAMLKHRLLDTVKGRDKGKYRFRAAALASENHACTAA